MKSLVLGASANPDRYSYKATKMLEAYGHEVVAIGIRKDKIGETLIITEKPLFTDIDTVAMYLSPKNQKEYYNYIISLQPRRIIFNPGSENPAFSKKAKANGIKTFNSCVLVMLRLNQF